MVHLDQGDQKRARLQAIQLAEPRPTQEQAHRGTSQAQGAQWPGCSGAGAATMPPLRPVRPITGVDIGMVWNCGPPKRDPPPDTAPASDAPYAPTRRWPARLDQQTSPFNPLRQKHSPQRCQKRILVDLHSGALLKMDRFCNPSFSTPLRMNTFTASTPRQATIVGQTNPAASACERPNWTPGESVQE